MVSPTEKLDLSFARFVRTRKAVEAGRLREGAFYAYAGDRRVRRTLEKLRPVGLALAAALRHFEGHGRQRLLADAVPVDDRGFPALHLASLRAAAALGIAPVSVFVTGAVFARDMLVLGGGAAATILLPGALGDQLSPPECLATFGSAYGHIHNNHTPLLSALFYLETAATGLARLAARPAAAALEAWRDRALVTADRAGLLAVRDLDAAAGALFKRFAGARGLVADVDVPSCIAAIDSGDPPAAMRVDPARFRAVCRRVRALRVFAETTFYRAGSAEDPAGVQDGAGAAGPPRSAGISLSLCDERTSVILSEPA